MNISEREIRIPRALVSQNPARMMDGLGLAVQQHLGLHEQAVRFVVTHGDAEALYCELGVADCPTDTNKAGIFHFRQRRYADASSFNAVFLVPTGIGAELGGHSGDAGAAGKLLAGCCDQLVTHPNVANAADINELPHNSHYVEGSVISDLLMGAVALAPVRANRLFLLMEQHPDPWFMDATVNMASAARAAAGIDVCRVVVLPNNFTMRSLYSPSGRAVGQVEGVNVVYETLDELLGQFDAIAVASLIKVPPHFHAQYFGDSEDLMVNPWGGVEAMLTHALSRRYRVPSAHAPMMTSREVQTLDFGPVDPRKAAEPVSATYLFSVLKGLHRSPRIIEPVTDQPLPGCLQVENIHALVIPDGCIGLPTLAALVQGIPVVAVRGNRNRMRNRLDQLPFRSGQLHFADNYLEAAGVLMALRSGVSLESVQRPLLPTRVTQKSTGHAGTSIHNVH